ncbi:MAG: alpha/beta hydrolase [Deltaproteobacteria bacterium]|nr:alpha/beta hydrolase [Deltaproteobacteria bacterium]
MRTLLLPGLDGTGRLFDPLLGVLPDRGAAVVVSYPFDAIDYPACIARAEAALGPEPAFVIAESFSGPVGVELALRYPDRVVGLVLVASFLTNPMPLLALLLPWRLALSFRGSPRFAGRLLGEGASAELVSEFSSTLASVPANTLTGRIGAISRLKSQPAESRGCSVLYLRASKDRLVPARCEHEVRTVFPKAKTAVLDGTHFLLQTRPAECAGVVDEFRRRQVRERRASER